MRLGAWSRETAALMLSAAVLPPVAVFCVETGANGIARLALSVLVIALWQAVFLALRAQPPSTFGLVTAMLVAMLVPADIAAWQLALGVSFGAVLGEGVFGGWGRNIVSPAVATLAFVFFAFPDIPPPSPDGWTALATLPGALALALVGVISLRVLAGAVAGGVLVTLALGADVASLASAGALILGVVFLVADPVSASTTPGGRWMYGGLSGALAGVFGWAGYGIAAPQAVVFAALLASLFAPLLDHAAIGTAKLWRRRSHG